MARPTTKATLLSRADEERAALTALVDSLPAERILAPGALGEWSVKDAIAHLAAWNRLFAEWYAVGARGETPSLPAEGYTWREMDELNDVLLRTWRDEPWDAVLTAWNESSAQLRAIVEGASVAALFTSGTYAWTGRSTLAAYAWACGGEHDEWARTELEKGLRRSRDRST